MKSTLRSINLPPVLVYVINVDWYFKLHWLARAEASQHAGFKVHIITANTDKGIFEHLSQMGFVCHAWQIDRKSLNPFLFISNLVSLYAILKSISPDLIHAITIKPNICVGLLAYRLKKPYILSVTGTGVIFSGNSLTIRLVKPIIRLLYKLLKSTNIARQCVFENDEDHAYFVNTGLCAATEALTILGAGVNTDIYKPVSENETDTPVLLFAARLLWDKGLGDLIAAAKLLHQQPLKFVIQVAGIIDHSAMNAMAESTLEQWQDEGKIQWLGTVSQMPELIARANIVVLPTFYGEGVPRILIEAASSARVLVATDMPGCREIVQHGVNGLLIPARNIEALADALSILIKNPELRKTMGENGRKLVMQQFSEQMVISKTLALYQQLLAVSDEDTLQV